MDIGKNVKDARKRAQLSQEALARQAGISVSAVAQIEQGERTDPHYSTLSKLAKGLGISVGELLDSPKAEAPTSSTSPEGAVEDRRTVEEESALVERARAAGERVRKKMEAAGEIPAGYEEQDEELRGPEFALETLAHLVAGRGEELKDVLNSSKGDFPLELFLLFDDGSQAVRIMHDKEPHTIQQAPRVKEAMEILSAVEQEVNKSLDPWRSRQNRSNQAMWEQRARFIERRSSETRRYLEVDEGQEGSKALKS